MSELLFVEIGGFVTEILGPTRCTFEPSCDPTPPTWARERRVEVDFAQALESLLARGAGAAAEARYDQFVGPPGAEGADLGSAPLGPSWPGGAYEGVVRVRQDLVEADRALAAAAAALPGRRWEHHIVAVIDDKHGTVRRYRGFHAEVAEIDADRLVLRVAHAGTSAAPRWSPRTVIYTPSDTARFYAGRLVEDVVVGGPSQRKAGAVFIALTAASTDYLLEVPKLPHGAGL